MGTWLHAFYSILPCTAEQLAGAQPFDTSHCLSASLLQLPASTQLHPHHCSAQACQHHVHSAKLEVLARHCWQVVMQMCLCSKIQSATQENEVMHHQADSPWWSKASVLACHSVHPHLQYGPCPTMLHSFLLLQLLKSSCVDHIDTLSYASRHISLCVNIHHAGRPAFITHLNNLCILLEISNWTA